MQKKYAVIIALVILAAAVVAVSRSGSFKKLMPGPKDKLSGEQQPAPPPPEITQVPDNQLPQGLPKSLPLEPGAEILENSTIRQPGSGKTQATRVYVSGKTSEQNYSLFEKYLKDNGWQVLSSANYAETKSFSATKGTARLDIIVGSNPDGKITVRISHLQ